jgi:hypothetical protein
MESDMTGEITLIFVEASDGPDWISLAAPRVLDDPKANESSISFSAQRLGAPPKQLVRAHP